MECQSIGITCKSIMEEDKMSPTPTAIAPQASLRNKKKWRIKLRKHDAGVMLTSYETNLEGERYLRRCSHVLIDGRTFDECDAVLSIEAPKYNITSFLFTTWSIGTNMVNRPGISTHRTSYQRRRFHYQCTLMHFNTSVSSSVLQQPGSSTLSYLDPPSRIRHPCMSCRSCVQGGRSV